MTMTFLLMYHACEIYGLAIYTAIKLTRYLLNQVNYQSPERPYNLIELRTQ